MEIIALRHWTISDDFVAIGGVIDFRGMKGINGDKYLISHFAL